MTNTTEQITSAAGKTRDNEKKKVEPHDSAAPLKHSTKEAKYTNPSRAKWRTMNL